MFDTFNEKLPYAKFVVVNGLLLPGRNEHIKMTQQINRQLAKPCAEREYIRPIPKKLCEE